MVADGAVAAASIEELAGKLEDRRIFWVMLPAGAITEDMIQQLLGLARAGDIIIDGGNSFYKDDIRRAKACAAKQVSYVDVGTSGGVWGLERGYCMMIGGDNEAVDLLDPILTQWRRASATLRAPRSARPARVPTQGPRKAISTPVPPARGTSSRWCTTASNTG